MSAARGHLNPSSSSTVNEEEDSDEASSRERRAVADLSEFDDSDAALVEEQLKSNSSSGRNAPMTKNELDHTEVLNLFNRLHICGLQQRQLPREFTPACISSILLTVKPVLLSEPSCLEISSPVVLFGDIHGEFQILAKLNDLLGRPPGRSYLYLGDYVDRGPNSLETLVYLMLLKIIHPTTVFVLRGNHEDRRVYRHFNFENDLIRIFGTADGQKLSMLFSSVLACMPLCAIINGEIFCCHGGLSPRFNHTRFAKDQKGLASRINSLPKPVLFRRHDFVADLLWSDPLDVSNFQMPNLRVLAPNLDEWFTQRCRVLERHIRSSVSISDVKIRSRSQTARTLAAQSAASSSDCETEPIATAVDWLPNPRGISYTYSFTALAEFMRRYRINWLVRGHMFVSNGLKVSLGGRCFTLFSAADYAQKYHNTAAIMIVQSVTGSRRDFPGRVMRYTKSSLLNFNGALPVDAEQWPDEIIARTRLTF